MLGIVGFHMPLVEIEHDGPLGDIEGEFAVAAVVVFPAVLILAEGFIDERLDRLRDGPAVAVNRGASPMR